MPTALPLHTLRAFVAAAETGSFTAASPRLHITPGAVSRQVQQLEEHFGRPLFVRQARGLSLTAEGQLLLQAVREAFDTLSRADAAIRQPTRPLTLQLPPTFAARWFLPRLADLRAAMPTLDLRMATNWTDAPDFSRGDADAIVAYGQGGWPGVEATLLMQERFTAFCTPAMARRLKTVTDLASVELLHSVPQRQQWKQWLSAVRARGVPYDRGQVFDTLDLALQAAARGLGVAIADPAMLGESLSAGVLVSPFNRPPFKHLVPTGSSYHLCYAAGNSPADATTPLGQLQAWLLKQMEAPTAAVG